MFFFFFFSSRRRHTRLTCDWSSDVSLPICHRQGPGSAGQRSGLPQGRGGRAAGVVGTAGQEHDRPRRSEERRVGKECRSRWAACHLKKKNRDGVRRQDVKKRSEKG